MFGKQPEAFGFSFEAWCRLGVFSTTVQLFRENILFGIGASAWGFWCSRFSVKMDFTPVHIRRLKCSNALHKSHWKGGSRKLALPTIKSHVGFFCSKRAVSGAYLLHAVHAVISSVYLR